MELGRTENSEIIFIHTDDPEVTIKGGASGDLPPFVMPDQMESSVAIMCNAGFIPSVRGRAKVVSDAAYAGKCTATISCDPLFFEQISYTLIAQANEGHKLEFDHENANLRNAAVKELPPPAYTVFIRRGTKPKYIAESSVAPMPFTLLFML